jgi:hypothetical protein
MRFGTSFARMNAMFRIAIAVLAAFLCSPAVHAQVDPVRRDLFELGYDQPLAGHAPVGAYVFYYLSRPQFGDADHALRVALSPVYVDAEWAVRDAFALHTDVGIEISGGGFADDYNEIRDGRWLRDQSFIGHDGGVAVNVYHLFNPGARFPLSGIVQGGVRYVAFQRTSRNPPAFVIPQDQAMATLRIGLRAGGIEPVLAPEVAGELSVWYEALHRLQPGTYGFADDRRVESTVQRFWARALLVYTTPTLHHRLSLDAIGGASVNADRLSAWRIGGILPLDAEFPLALPGYYEGELSARNFILVGADYSAPLDAAEHWRLGAGAAVARVGFTPGLEEAHAWNSGMSASLGYVATHGAWKASLVYGHAFDAIRDGRRGADSLTLLVELDLERMGYVAGDTAADARHD